MTTPTRAAAERTGVEAPLLLALALGAAIAGTAIGVVLLAVGYEEDAESALYLAAFAIGLPLAVVAALRLAPVAQAGAGSHAALARWALLGLLAVLGAARLCAALDAPRAGAAVLAAGSLAWLLAVVACVRSARLPAAPPPGWLFAAACVAIAVCLTPGPMLRPGPLAVSALLAAALIGLHRAVSGRPIGRLPGRALDVAVVLLVFGLTLDFTTSLDPQRFVEVFGNVHHDFYLGPANDVLSGRALLVESVSQYGILPIHLVAASSLLMPLGYDSLGLTAGLLTAAGYAALYGVLRLAGCARTLAAAGTIGAVLIANFGGWPHYGSVLPVYYPATGGLRFVLVWLVLLLGVCAAAGVNRRLVRPALALVVAASSLWSIEVFGYTGCVIVAMAAASIASAPRPREELRRRLTDAAILAALCVLAHVLFALITVMSAGEWPDWDRYIELVRFYAGVSGYSRPIPSWSPSLGAGAAAFGSLAALAVLSIRDRSALVEQRAAAVAIAGCASFAAVALSYFVGQSLAYQLQAVSAPAVALVFLWAAFLYHARAVPEGVRQGATIAAFALAALLVVGAWDNFSRRFETTALGLSVPWVGNSGTLLDRVEFLGDMAPLDPRVPAAERLLERHMPGDGPAGMVADADLTVETLFRAGRANQLPVAHPLQEGLVLEPTLDRLREAVDDFRPGTRFLVQSDRLVPGAPMLPFDRGVMDLLQQRFRLVPVESVPEGLTVVRLEPRLVGSGP